MSLAAATDKKCRECGGVFHPRNSMATVCGPVCATKYAKNLGKERKVKEKAERAHTKARKEAAKRLPDLIQAAQKEFNAYVRARDKDKPCICCGRDSTAVDGLGSHGWDAGHYRSTGSASHLRFNEDNCHRQLVYCNRHGAGRAVDYRLGLIGRIGLSRVEALEADNEPHKWTREELIAIRATYKQKLKELEKA